MNPTLSYGSSGQSVRLLQTLLNGWNTSLPDLSSDGKFGPKTLAKTKSFQLGAKLAADGIVGPKTWSRLLQTSTTGPVTPHFCDQGNPAHRQTAMSMAKDYAALAALLPGAANDSSAPAAKFSAASLLGLRAVSLAEKAVLLPVFGSSIDFSTVLVSSKTGVDGRQFVLTVPGLLPGSSAIQIVNIGTSPSSSTILHEFTHVWQSQHSADALQYMVSAVTCQAVEKAMNESAGKDIVSAYAYIPGKTFGSYNVEQIAQQVGNGETAVQTECGSAARRSIHAGNKSCLGTISVQALGVPGVKLKKK